jgi:hypothetical protein
MIAVMTDDLSSHEVRMVKPNKTGGRGIQRILRKSIYLTQNRRWYQKVHLENFSNEGRNSHTTPLGLFNYLDLAKLEFSGQEGLG